MTKMITAKLQGGHYDGKEIKITEFFQSFVLPIKPSFGGINPDEEIKYETYEMVYGSGLTAVYKSV